MLKATKSIFSCFVIACLISLTACGDSDDKYPSATLGDLSALQKLADSYRQQSDRLEGTPLQLRPEARKKFLLHVFNKVGLSYHNTLIALGNTDIKTVSDKHRDLAQLLRLPHYGQEESVKKEIYDQEELAAINKMEKW